MDQAEKLRQKIKVHQKPVQLVQLLLFSEASLVDMLRGLETHFHSENKKCCVFICQENKVQDGQWLGSLQSLQLMYLNLARTSEQQEEVFETLRIEEHTLFLFVSFYASLSRSLPSIKMADNLVLGVPDNKQFILEAYSAIKYIQQSKIRMSYSILGLKSIENSTFTVQSVIDTAKKFLGIPLHNIGNFYLNDSTISRFVREVFQQGVEVPQSSIWQLLQAGREEWSNEKN